MPDPKQRAWLLRDVEVDGTRCDVRIRDGRVHAIGPGLPDEADETRLDGARGALLPGLHDHHLHLLALAASLESVVCGPPDVTDATQLAAALQAAARSGDSRRGLRGVGYHERVAGDLDRFALDRLGPDCPIRVQHRSGVRWILNTRALEQLGPIAPDQRPPGLEIGLDGAPTGRLDRGDAWLRTRLGEASPPDLGRIGRLLTSYGVTGACDATPGNDADSLALLERASACRDLPQRLLVMGGDRLPSPASPRLRRGARKVLLDEDALPEREALIETIARTHASGRSVAFHCVTRAELVFAASALESAGCTVSDRIEHASIAPPDCVAWLARLGVTVVTQPNFLRERGDAYLVDVAPADRPWLYRCRGFLEAGVPLGGGTDAPFGDADPWRAMRAAVDRRSASGVALGPAESASPEVALALFTTPLEAPGGTPRRLEAGAPADLCLLDRTWGRARDRLNADDVAGVWMAGERVDAPR